MAANTFTPEELAAAVHSGNAQDAIQRMLNFALTDGALGGYSSGRELAAALADELTCDEDAEGTHTYREYLTDALADELDYDVVMEASEYPADYEGGSFLEKITLHVAMLLVDARLMDRDDWAHARGERAAAARMDETIDALADA